MTCDGWDACYGILFDNVSNSQISSNEVSKIVTPSSTQVTNGIGVFGRGKASNVTLISNIIYGLYGAPGTTSCGKSGDEANGLECTGIYVDTITNISILNQTIYDIHGGDGNVCSSGDVGNVGAAEGIYSYTCTNLQVSHVTIYSIYSGYYSNKSRNAPPDPPSSDQFFDSFGICDDSSEGSTYSYVSISNIFVDSRNGYNYAYGIYVYDSGHRSKLTSITNSEVKLTASPAYGFKIENSNLNNGIELWNNTVQITNTTTDMYYYLDTTVIKSSSPCYNSNETYGSQTCLPIGGCCVGCMAAVIGSMCRPNVSMCDIAETCNGDMAFPPDTNFQGNSTICHTDPNPCGGSDIYLYCNGTAFCNNASIALPASNCSSNVTLPTSPPSIAPVTLPPTPSPTPPPSCGNFVVESGEECDSNSPCCLHCRFAPASYVCRPSASKCDTVEVCGKNGECPPDTQETMDSCGVCGGDNKECTPEGVCGDTLCYGSETCQNCPIDCGSCSSTCPNGCNGNGECVNGLCFCTGEFSGAACDQRTTPIVIGTNSTSPVIELSSSNVKFSISLHEIREISSLGNVVQSFSLRTVNLSAQANNTQSDIFQYKIDFNNSAYMIITFTSIHTSTPTTFANQSFVLQPNSIKLTMEVYSWPFQVLRNQMQIIFGIDSSIPEACQSSVTDPSGNTRAFSFFLNGTEFYGRFLDNALVDNSPKPMLVHQQNDQIILTLPHFWVYSIIDPDFSVLLVPSSDGSGKDEDEGNGNCLGAIHQNKKKKVSNGVIIGVTVGVVGAALALGAITGIMLYNKKKQRHMKLTQMSTM
eukprot:Phypoly_transcript_02467.p1 GENE.Phypoly_transcript_02467~~Phypoly_transcript_02467.p1  ORF type:complete len:887 (+),score=102.50 Phypoly_transcript_02467:228-2663(+)